MKAIILAAGRGERMRPLTDHTPKPLLHVGGKPLIQYHIDALCTAGITDLVINLGHLGEQIRTALGDGSRLGVKIAYSPEPPGALETGGGILQALPLLGTEPFLVINGDIWCDYPFARIPTSLLGIAHLILVANPPQHLDGDFALCDQQVSNNGPKRLTFSGISILRPELFSDCNHGRFSVIPLIRCACEAEQVSGEYYCGRWYDIGTPQRLMQLDTELSAYD